MVAIECDGHSIFLDTTAEGARYLVWTNKPADCKIEFDRAVLTRLIFGVADPMECFEKRELKVKSTADQRQVNMLLRHMFPRNQFLIMDSW